MSTDFQSINRRQFLQTSLAASSLAFAALSFEEQALLAQEPAKAPASSSASPKAFPAGRIGSLTISRMICGGNLISGFAHSRDLIYVSRLLKQYFTDEKVHDTLQQCESMGINTAILRVDHDTIRILRNYRKDRGGKIQWIAQAAINEQDFSDIRIAIDNGAAAVYTHGGVGDFCAQSKKVDVLGKALDMIRQNKAVAGIAGHLVAVPVACEEAGLKPDFYMKTFNSRKYWSAEHPTKHDNVWDEEPEKTKEVMAKVTRPWIAYKVLGAGAIHPKDGFPYAFNNGADFICVGMFDFQIAEDVQFATNAIRAAQQRSRTWRA